MCLGNDGPPQVGCGKWHQGRGYQYCYTSLKCEFEFYMICIDLQLLLAMQERKKKNLHSFEASYWWQLQYRRFLWLFATTMDTESVTKKGAHFPSSQLPVSVTFSLQWITRFLLCLKPLQQSRLFLWTADSLLCSAFISFVLISISILWTWSLLSAVGLGDWMASSSLPRVSFSAAVLAGRLMLPISAFLP